MLTINNTLDGYLKDVEIKGNTIQDASNLADIRSVGDKVEGQELYEIPVLSRGKNLANPNNFVPSSYITSDGFGNYTIVKTGTGLFIPLLNNLNLKGSTYTIKVETLSGVYTGGNILFYGLDGVKFTEYNTNGLNNTSTITTTTGLNTIKLYGANGDATFRIQIEEGTVATPYEPYQEDKLTILSPVQLEKVGDVRDRIIEKDGVWGVEKHVGSVIFDGTENWGANSTSSNDNYRTVYVKPSNYASASFSGLCDKLPTTYSNSILGTTKCIYFGGNINISIPVSELKTNDLVGAKTWLQVNPILVKYITTDHQFIPLPHSQQVKLRTFANKTNISFLTEIEGTIKAQVPKSLGATVSTHTTQIDNLFDLVMGIISNVHIEEDETSIVGNTLNLTTDKYQVTNMVNNTQIVLPTVDKFTEIHLFFDATSDMTLVYPEVKWQTVPTIKANASYEFIFTYVNDTWLGGFIVRK